MFYEYLYYLCSYSHYNSNWNLQYHIDKLNFR